MTPLLGDVVPKDVLLITNKVDGTNLLLQDHRMIFSLFNRQFLKMLSSSTDDPDSPATAANIERKQQIWATISREICAHDAMENVVIYPLVAQYMTDGDRFARESLREHAQIARLLLDMRHMNAGSHLFHQSAHHIMQLFREHIEKEETVLIPFIRENMTEKQLRLLHAAINDAKAIAPHSPQPSDDWFSGPMTTSYELLRESLIHPE